MPLWFRDSKPQDIKPRLWLSDAAIAFLTGVIKPSFDVLEHGGGGSTLWFSGRVKSVRTYENNPEWATAITSHNKNNVTVFNGSIENDVETVKPCDLLLIDGEPLKDRETWIYAVPYLVKKRGWVVLDNANRPDYADARAWIGEIAELKYTSPLEGSFLVTEFYRIP